MVVFIHSHAYRGGEETSQRKCSGCSKAVFGHLDAGSAEDGIDKVHDVHI